MFLYQVSVSPSPSLPKINKYIALGEDQKEKEGDGGFWMWCTES